MPKEASAGLHEASLRLLERTGVRVESSRARDILSAAGVKIEPSNERA